MAHSSDGKLSCQHGMPFGDAGSEVMESNFRQRLLSKRDNQNKVRLLAQPGQTGGSLPESQW
jgi:hypothetical protein